MAWDLLNNKHDSMMVQCPEKEVEECLKLTKELMEIELTSNRGVKFRMGSEAMVGKNWKDMVEVKE